MDTLSENVLIDNDCTRLQTEFRSSQSSSNSQSSDISDFSDSERFCEPKNITKKPVNSSANSGKSTTSKEYVSVTSSRNRNFESFHESIQTDLSDSSDDEDIISPQSGNKKRILSSTDSESSTDPDETQDNSYSSPNTSNKYSIQESLKNLKIRPSSDIENIQKDLTTIQVADLYDESKAADQPPNQVQNRTVESSSTMPEDSTNPPSSSTTPQGISSFVQICDNSGIKDKSNIFYDDFLFVTSYNFPPGILNN